MAQLAASEKAKEEAKAARGGKRISKKAAAAAATAQAVTTAPDAVNLLENLYHEGEFSSRQAFSFNFKVYLTI